MEVSPVGHRTICVREVCLSDRTHDDCRLGRRQRPSHVPFSVQPSVMMTGAASETRQLEMPDAPSERLAGV